MKRPPDSLVATIESIVREHGPCSTTTIKEVMDELTWFTDDLLYYAERRGYIKRVKRGNRYSGPAIWSLP